MTRQITPAERQWLNLISYAEGTWRGNQPGYNVMFGGGTFNDLSRHPDRVIRTPSFPRGSAAAGAYQFMPGTWSEVSRQLGLRDFSPASQDLAALQLIRRRGVDPNTPITRESVARLAPEWAALPTLQGQSYYGQPVRRFEDLTRFVQRHGGSVPTSPASVGSSTLRRAGAQPTTSTADPSQAAQFDSETALAQGLIQGLAGQLLGSFFQTPQVPTSEIPDVPYVMETDDDIVDRTVDATERFARNLGERLQGIETRLSNLQQLPQRGVEAMRGKIQSLIQSARDAFEPGRPVI